MNAKEIRDLEHAELGRQIATLRKDLFGLRFANATGELEDTAGIARARRDLARALTVARERELVVADQGLASETGTTEQEMRADG